MADRIEFGFEDLNPSFFIFVEDFRASGNNFKNYLQPRYRNFWVFRKLSSIYREKGAGIQAQICMVLELKLSATTLYFAPVWKWLWNERSPSWGSSTNKGWKLLPTQNMPLLLCVISSTCYPEEEQCFHWSCLDLDHQHIYSLQREHPLGMSSFRTYHLLCKQSLYSRLASVSIVISRQGTNNLLKNLWVQRSEMYYLFPHVIKIRMKSCSGGIVKHRRRDPWGKRMYRDTQREAEYASQSACLTGMLKELSPSHRWEGLPFPLPPGKLSYLSSTLI